MFNKKILFISLIPFLALSAFFGHDNKINLKLNSNVEEHSYVESGPINWYPDSEEDSIKFGLTIHENENHDFYKKLIAEDGFYFSLYIWDYSYTSYDYFPCINMPEEEELDLNPTYEYIFEIDMGDFAAKQDDPTVWQSNYLFLLSKIENNILSIDDPYGDVENILSFNEFISNYYFETTIFNPYIVGKDGFKIIQTTSNSVEFQIKAINDYDESYDFANSSFDVTLNNTDSKEEINTTATYVSQGEEENTYIYQINNLNPNTNYEIISLNNTGLATESPISIINNEILISEDLKDGGLNADGSFKTEQDNPYIEEGGFEILSTTENSVKFQITVVEDADNSFDPSSPLEVTLNDSEGNPFNTTASYIEEESSGNNYVYEITELNVGENYEIISLNNTGLAVSDSINEIDNEISIIDDLGSEGNFTTLYNNPYIEEGGFEILSTTENSVKFQITVVEDADNSFDPSSPLEVTLNDSEGNPFNTTASYIEEESSSDNYVYEITELNEKSNYEIISLNNTGLATYNDINEIDNEILISDDLESEGNFTTLKNKIPNYVWIIIAIIIAIIIIIGILLLLRIINKNKREKDELNKLTTDNF